MKMIINDKLVGFIYLVGEKVGGLIEKMVQFIGFFLGMVVVVVNVDVYVFVLVVGIIESGKMLMIMGILMCYVFLGDEV